MDTFQSKDGVALALLMAEWGEGTALEMAYSLKVCGGKEYGHVSSRRGGKTRNSASKGCPDRILTLECEGSQAAAGREIIGDWPPRISE